MKARLVTLGETEIRRKVEEEYQKKKDEVYEAVINDVLPQFMAVCLCVLNKDHGFGRKRLLSFLDGVKTQLYMPTPEPHLHGVRTAPYRILNRILPEQNRT